MKLTIAISKGVEHYIGVIKEMPGVISQGASIEETKENLMDALQLYLEVMEAENGLENTVLEEDLNLVYVN
jgi:predicted RNase H-like HicB family nuclease